MARDETTQKEQDLIQEFLDRGGKITHCPPCTRTEPAEVTYRWGRVKRPKQVDKSQED